jgi:hypothetical protein
LGKVAKIAIGCVVVALLAGIVAVAAVGGLAWWGAGKVKEMAGSAAGSVEKIAELEKKANQNPFARPADGVVSEERLLKFIEVRKRVFAVYDQNRDFIERAGRKQQADLSDVTKGLSVLADVKTAQAQALADLGMSTAEYAFLVESVYKSLWASEWQKGQGGKSASEAMGEAATQVEKQLQGLGAPEAAKAIEDARAAAEQSKALDVPQANVELFSKHEAELKKYAMGGLELIGL